jgi:DNA-binding transcriptional LysR family regulator
LPRGHLHIGITQVLGSLDLPRSPAQFHHRYAAVTLTLRTGLIAELLDNRHVGTIDAFVIDIARKAVSRGDTAYVAGCLFRVVEVCAHALHGHAGAWLINEKGTVASAGRLPGAPARFAERAQGALAHLGTTPGELSDAIASVAELLGDTNSACQPSS